MSSRPTLEIIPEIPIPDHLRGEVRSKLAYVDELITSAWLPPDASRVVLTLHSQPNQEAVLALQEKVQRVVAALAKGAIKPKTQVLENTLDLPLPHAQDPMPELLQRGEISQEAAGLFTLGPLLSRLAAFFENHFLDLAASFGAAPYRFPALIPAAYLQRVNYFSAFPHSLTFATHLRTDLDVIDHFASQAVCDEHGHLNTPPASFAGVQALLSPAVCYHLYFALADQELPNGQLAATSVGNCFRYEGNNFEGLERLWNFTMREVIFVGSKEYVLSQRDTARQRMQAKLAEIGLAYRVESATDPFFIGEFRKQAAFQNAFQLKYEIRAGLPHKNTTLAVGSYNYHQDFFGRHLAIRLPDGSPAHTGCVAFGIERIVYAFVAQYGLNPQYWPPAVAAAFVGGTVN